MTRKTAVERFWRWVDKGDGSGCWLWTAAKRGGYGVFWYEGICDNAHRVSYLIHKGQIGAGLHVLHKCDVPACVNPDHLFVGTPSDNMADMKKKNRQANSTKLPQTKLTDAEVANVRRSDLSGTELSRFLGVSRALISIIRNNKYRVSS